MFGGRALNWISPVFLLTAALLAPATSSAEVSSSAISSPVNGAQLYVDASHGLTVQGTATASDPADTLEIDCYLAHAAGSVAMATSVPIVGGQFTAQIDPAIATLAGHCQLAAVPNGQAPADLDRQHFAGPDVLISAFTKTHDLTSGLETGFQSTISQPRGWFAYASPADCGLRSVLPGTETSPFQIVFNCSAYIANGPSGADALVVDGNKAISAESYPNLASFDRFLPSTASLSRDPSSGDTTITNVAPLMNCVGPPSPPNADNCDLGAAGVTLTRKIFQHADGLEAVVTDTYSSNDNNTHSLSTGYKEEVCVFGICSSGERTFEFPGATVTAPNFPDKIDGPFPDGSSIRIYDSGNGPQYGRGAITTSPGADRAEFGSVTSFWLFWGNRTVSPSRPLTIVQRFDQAMSASDLENLINPPVPVSPTISTVGKPKASWDPKKKEVIVGTAQRVSCPAGGGACMVTATLQTKFKKGKKTKVFKLKNVQLTVPAGSSAPIEFKMGSVKSNPLYKGSYKRGFKPLYGKLSFTGSVTATAAGAQAATSPIAFKLKLSKIPKKK